MASRPIRKTPASLERPGFRLLSMTGLRRIGRLALIVALVAVSAPIAEAQVDVPLISDGPSVEVQLTVSCLAGNGRVDINIVNTGTSAALYRIEFAGLSPRQLEVAPLDWWRMPVTGRADGTYQVAVMRNGQVVTDVPVQIACDVEAPLVTAPEVRVVNACRFGNGYVLFLFANGTGAAKPYVIEFDTVPNRSTTAPAFGQSVRAVTGRGDGSYAFVVRSGPSIVRSGSVQVACDAAGADTSAPTMPGNLIVRGDQLSATSAGVRWNAATDDVGVAAYRLYVNGNFLGSTPASATGFIFEDLVPDTGYSFGVSAVDAAGNESAIATAGARTLDDGADREAPSEPPNLIVRADQLTSTSAGLRWDAATDDVGVVGYEVAVNGVERAVLSGDATAYVVSDLSPATSYSFAVTALDAAGNRSAPAAAGVSTPAADGGNDQTAPSVPGDKVVRADQLTASAAGLTWSASTDDVGVVGYRIYANGDFAAQTAGDATSFVVTGLQPGTGYSFGVTAVDAAGNESAPALAGAMTLGESPGGGRDAAYYDELVPIPGEYVHPVFGELDSPRASYMESVLGDPNIANGDQDCGVNGREPEFWDDLELRRFDNMAWRVRAFPAVLDAIERVMDRVKDEHPELWVQIENVGAYCHRNIRGSNTPSNHAFGTAIDLYVLPAQGVDLDGNGLAQRGMVILGQYFQEEGFKWGAYFRSGVAEDVPHMEVSRQLLDHWASTGELP